MSNGNNNGYIVIRLVRIAAVDGPSFATYLDGLSLRVFAADTPADEPPVPLSDTVYCTPMVIYQADIFGDSVPYLTTVSNATSAHTPYVKTIRSGSSAVNDYGNTLTFNSTSGIAIGSGKPVSVRFPSLRPSNDADG